MTLLSLSGTPRTRYLNDIRNAHVFRVERPVTLWLEALYVEPQERLAWMECSQGTWRLPAEMREWAEEVEDRARALLGRDDILPCSVVFAPTEDGHFEVELRPHGYRPTLQT